MLAVGGHVLIDEDGEVIMLGEALSTKDVAKQLGCTERTVRNMIKRGELPARRLGERVWMIDRATLTRYMKVKKVSEPIE